MCDFVLSFGKFKGKTLEEVLKEENGYGYIIWLSGKINKYTIRTSSRNQFKEVEKEFPETVNEAKKFLLSVCPKCQQSNCQSHTCCFNVSNTSNYHYHPYGRRG